MENETKSEATQGACPNCGYCPHCKRATPYQLVPQVPYYPQFPWDWPWTQPTYPGPVWVSRDGISSSSTSITVTNQPPAAQSDYVINGVGVEWSYT